MSSEQQTERIGELTGKLSELQIDYQIVSDSLHTSHARNIVKKHVIASGGMGLVPVPWFDLAALATNQHEMVRNLCHHYGLLADEGKIKLLVLSLLTGALPVVTVMGLSSAVKLIPGIGTLGGSASVALLGGAVTYATGQTFIKHFNAGGTLEDFSPVHFRRFFRREFNTAKAMFGESGMKPATSG